MEVLDSVLVGSLSHLSNIKATVCEYIETSFNGCFSFSQVEANNQFRMSAEKTYMLRIEHFTARSPEPK